MVWVDTDGKSSKIGFSQSSQNKRELQVAIKLCQEYVKQGVMANDIVILTGYMAQANLTKRALALTTGLQEVDSGTIDGYQGGEKAITVLCMVGSEKLGFMALSARLLTAVSRAADGLAIITNSTGIETGENKRKRHVYGLLKHKIYVKGGFATYQDGLPELDLTMYDSDVSWDDADETNAEDHEKSRSSQLRLRILRACAAVVKHQSSVPTTE